MIKSINKAALGDIWDVILADIVATAMDAIVTVDESQRIIIFNSAAETMFGRTAADMLGQPLEMLIPERYRAAHAVHIQNFARTTVTRRTMGNLGALYGLRANGEEFPIEASISQSQIEQKRHFTVILRDISERRRVEETLHASTKLVQSIVESSDDAIIGKTLDGIIIGWNPGAERVFGYSAQEALGKSMLMLIPAERESEETAILARIGRGERVEHFETERIRKDGRRIDVSVTISPLHDSSGKIIGASKIARDITEYKRSLAKLVRLSRIHAVLSGINSLIVRTRDRQTLLEKACQIAVEQGDFGAAWIGLIDQHNGGIRATAWAGPNAEKLVRDSEDAQKKLLGGRGLVGRAISTKAPAFSNDIAADSDESVTQRMRASLDFGYRSLIALPLLVDGTAIGALELFAKERGFIDEGELRLLTEIAADISFALEHIEREDKLHYLAYHDPVTGLANRVLLHDRLEQAIRGAKHGDFGVALIFGDIKGFRQINETMSRHAGDELLREVGHRLTKLSPEPENVARISADYFAGIITDFKAPSDLVHLIEKSIAGSMSEPYRVADKSIHVSTRVGISVFPTDGADADTLFRNAEAAHRKAKMGGERYLFYQPQMNAHVAETLLLEHKLKVAIEQNEFSLYYQPKVDAMTGKTSGLEALIRWIDPDNGIVAPASFIPLLEDTGMILEVGQWVVRQAIADHALWTKQGLRPIRIAVNVSPIQLRQGTFVAMVRSELGEDTTDILELEITESMLMQNIDDNILKLKHLRAMGVTIAIDDFGTGYSSLSYMTRLPINTVKIDRAFVEKLTTDPDTLTIISMIIALARALKLLVVAEGVETEEQARLLRLLKCDYLQGYLFGKPLPALEIVRFLEAS